MPTVSCCSNVLRDKILDCELFGYLFRLDMETLVRFTLTVRKGYRGVAYHNWGHAFAVAHSMCVLMKMASEMFTWEEVFVYLSILFCNYAFCGGLH